jgi:FkbM family methyltransferase
MGRMQAQIDICGRLVPIIGDENDRYFAHYAQYPVYVDDITGVLGSIVQPHHICFDIGANIGLTSIFMAILAPDGQVHAFEPDSTSYEFLATNTSSFDNVITQRSAIGSVEGELPMVKVSGFSAGNFLVRAAGDLKPEQEAEIVPLRRLDRYIEEGRLDRVDIVKIDVEGFEVDVIEGAQDTLRRYNPVVILEFNTDRIANAKHHIIDLFKIFDLICIIDRNSQDVLRLELNDRLLDTVIEVNRLEGCVDNLLCLYKVRRVDGLVITGYYKGLVEKLRRTLEHRDQAIRDRDHAIWLYRRAVGEI